MMHHSALVGELAAFTVYMKTDCLILISNESSRLTEHTMNVRCYHKHAQKAATMVLLQWHRAIQSIKLHAVLKVDKLATVTT